MTFFNSSPFVLLLGSLAFPFVPQSAERKPVETSEAVVNYAAPPATLEGLAQLSSAVIVGRIAGADAQAEWENRGYAVSTNYQVSITEVLKLHPQLPVVGTVVTVKRMGGDFDAGDRLVRGVEHGFPQFSIGKTYLLFLHWNQAKATFEVRAGPNGAYRVSNGILESDGRAPVANQQKGRRLDSVLAELKTVIPG